MSLTLNNLEPQAIWQHFAALNAVPRASKKEERVIAFALAFGNSLGLATEKDAVGNVLIRKPATPGMENRKTVVLQSHLDMVHQKNNDTIFDFDQEGIRMLVEGDWVQAEGTTLGADNGIGVATIMAILAADNIPHPALEALFTIDEETGMTGAKGLQGGFLTGDILLNLDTEQDNEIDIGCAGGIDVTASLSYAAEAVPSDFDAYTLTVNGLHGGHSGMEIHKGLGNANKLMNRVLYLAQAHGARISTIHGGGLRNAIPRESVALIHVSKAAFPAFKTAFEELVFAIQVEYQSVDAGLAIQLEATPVAAEASVLPLDLQEKLISSVYTAANGVYKMSPDFEGLVETSNNVARVQVENGEITIKCLTRSSVESSKLDLAQSLQSAFSLMGAAVTFSGDYPGWTPKADSEILALLQTVYVDLFQEQPDVVACHAGLECGLLGSNYPAMDMISFGPTILGAHSPKERVSISSVQKFWKYVLAILANIPVKK